METTVPGESGFPQSQFQFHELTCLHRFVAVLASGGHCLFSFASVWGAQQDRRVGHVII
jgi:hypothetical protein